MVEYAETTECRRALILRYFGELPPKRCERCDACLRGEEPPYPEDLFAEILALREELAAESSREPDRVYERRTARELAAARPHSEQELLAVWGMAERRIRWFGGRLIALITMWEAGHPDASPRTVLEPPRLSRGGSRVSMGPKVASDDPVLLALRKWRSERARMDKVPAYTLFADRTLHELAFRQPADTHDLLTVWGLGEARVQRFGEELLIAIRESL